MQTTRRGFITVAAIGSLMPFVPGCAVTREWLQAIRDGQPTAPLCGIPCATRLTELVLPRA
ncbi:MAG: hypothetical protein FJ252_06830 [Phycisphaerae bacterium]|nr:hypothetical protein [Phycisphaerae bacterium]